MSHSLPGRCPSCGVDLTSRPHKAECREHRTHTPPEAFDEDVANRRQPQAKPLPDDAAGRKAVPLMSGCLDYFPDALAAVAATSRAGNDQHNPGKPIRWDRSKSGDEADALSRHLLQRGTVDTDGIRHSAKVAWRALALLQKELEEAHGLPLPRGAVASHD